VTETTGVTNNINVVISKSISNFRDNREEI